MLALLPGAAFGLGEPIDIAGDDQVLALLPADAVDAELGALQARLVQHPGDAAAASRLVRRYLDLAAASGDGRYLGYAEAVLARWNDAPMPPGLALMQAALHQRNHEFARAVTVLDEVIAARPRSGQARLVRAYVRMTQGRPQAAMPDCMAVSLLVGTTTGLTCISRAQALLGRADSAYRNLSAFLDLAESTPAEHKEAEFTLAEIATWLGKVRAAEDHYRSALVQAPDDALVLAAYADLLLSGKRYRECLALLEPDAGRHAALSLRAAIAGAALALPSAAVATARLERYFDTRRLRGDPLASRELARYLLDVAGRPARALAVALDNWRHQREPDDARLVVAAAHAAGRPEAARAVMRHAERTGFRDARLDAFDTPVSSIVSSRRTGQPHRIVF